VFFPVTLSWLGFRQPYTADQCYVDNDGYRIMEDKVGDSPSAAMSAQVRRLPHAHIYLTFWSGKIVKENVEVRDTKGFSSKHFCGAWKQCGRLFALVFRAAVLLVAELGTGLPESRMSEADALLA